MHSEPALPAAARGTSTPALAGAAVLGTALLLLYAGVSVYTTSTIVLCVAAMSVLYADSSDLLDFRAAFFLAVLLFIAIPGASIDVELTGSAQYWSAALVRNLTITRDQLRFAELLVFAGTAAAAVPLLRGLGTRQGARENDVEAAVSPRIWMIYIAATVGVVALAIFQYGGLMRMVIYMVSPGTRAAAARIQMAGLSNLMLFVSSIAAYFAASRVKGKGRKLLLFLPVMILVLPAGNRGSLLSVGLIAAAALSPLSTRRPMAWVMTAAMLLPVFASLMFRLRRLALMTTPEPITIRGLYADFAGESLMLPTMAYALHALRDRVVDYAYGLDLIMLPLWYVPRMIWPTKPLPLDFRLNAAMGLNDGDVFGTPISVFGGLWFNFTPLGYVPACIATGLLFAWLWRRFRHDRLIKLLLLTFAVDLVRVGDLSRELTTVLLGIGAAVAIRWYARETAPAPVAESA